MSGARQVLQRLARHHTLGLVTSGDRQRVCRQLRAFELTRVFRARVCGGDTAEKKPHPAPLLLALGKMKLGPNECVYVGDTPEDLAMARAAGVRAIALLGPFPIEKRLRAAKPEFLLRRLADLPALLQQLYPNSHAKTGLMKFQK
jgi:phosphoglycolate phosphatase-like HAD superfamily hydrolase